MVDFSQYMPVIGRANAVGDNLTGYNTPERITQRQMMAVQQQEQQRKMVENQEMLRKLEISKQVWQQSGGDLNRYHQLMSAYAPENAMAAQEFTRKQEELNAPTITIQDGNVIKRSRYGEVSAMPIPGYQQKQDKPTFSADLGGYIYPPDAQNPQGRLVRIPGASKPKEPKAPEFNKDMGGYVYPPDAQNPQGRFVPLQGAAQGQVKLNPTIQKEVFEADEGLQAAQNVKGILNEALTLNKQAYSGYGAKPRAVLRSNLPGESQEADATINLDNMMTGQALESLKLIFGGMPTEGERKILLDMQASADKTPAQREMIIKRAIDAAGRRQQFNESKANALRSGTYWQGGYSPVAGQSTKPQSGGDAMNNMPPANSASGRVVRDTSTGIRYKSDGSRWVRVE